MFRKLVGWRPLLLVEFRLFNFMFSSSLRGVDGEGPECRGKRWEAVGRRGRGVLVKVKTLQSLADTKSYW